jgi:EmrB/QacA subfamily drug resistance transporter
LTGERYEPDPRRWKALAVALVAGFMTLLDISIVNVALPSIRDSLHASRSQLQWVLSGYALTFGLLLVPAGRLGDARGRRNVFVAGVALFSLASAGAGVATTATMLVIARFVQGLAGGILTPQVSGLIQQLFRGAERGRAFGMLGTTVGISTAVGPLLGGVLIHFGGVQEGWRWVFYVNIPIGILAIVLAYRLIPGPPGTPGRQESLDPVGVVILGLGVASILLPVVQEREWSGYWKWLLLVAGIALLAVFVAWERRYARRASAVVDLNLFGRRSYGLGVLIALIYFAGFTAIFFIFTVYLQIGLGYSALLAGAAITPFALGSAVSAALGGRVVVRFGRPLVVAGLATVAVGLGGAALAVEFVPGRTVALATAAPLLLAGLGSGLVITPNQTLTLAEVPVERAGSAGGVLQTSQRMGSAVGIAAVGSVFFASVATYGNYALAFRHALLVAIAFVLVALVAAVADVTTGSRGRHRERAGARPGG